MPFRACLRFLLAGVYLMGSSSLTVGMAWAQTHRLSHEMAPDVEHEHHGEHDDDHSHEPTDPSHVPLPFDGFLNVTSTFPAKMTFAQKSLALGVPLSRLRPLPEPVTVQRLFPLVENGPPRIDSQFTRSLPNRAPPSRA
jgi:hypothetical protein